MALKNIVMTLIVLFPFVSLSQREIPEAELKEKTRCITVWMESQTGVIEKTNRNDGKEIDEYFRFIGLGRLKNAHFTARAYCGAFVANAWLHCLPRIPFVSSPAQLASVDAWRNATRYHISKSQAKPGDVVVFKAYRHVEGIVERHPNPNFPYLTVIGGNTSAEKGNAIQNQGVHRKTRLWRDISFVVSLEKTMSYL